MTHSQSAQRRNLIIQIIVLLVICSAATAVLFASGAFKKKVTVHRVTFEVNASGGYASITLTAPTDSITQPKIVTTPWRKTMTISAGAQIYLTAANPTQTGQIKCAIYLDDKPWKNAETVTPKNGVACAGIVP